MNRSEGETFDLDRGAFGPLLRRFRLAANMSQEELAERARLSVESVSALERGRRRAPYRETIRMLADALRLGERERDELIVAARRGKSISTITYDGPTSNADAVTTNLPPATTKLIGRDTELAALGALCADKRLVTIVGAGGLGKTRLAIEVARRIFEAERIETRFVDLAPLRDASLSAIHVNAAIGGPPGLPDGAGDAIVKRIGTARMVLVIDNCEHVIDNIARVCELIVGACPNVRLLATSREPLRLPAETVYRLASLAIPADDEWLTPAQVRGLSSVELFLERARASNPALLISDNLLIDVAAICRRLDGIPLAIELAAAQAQILSVSEFRHQLTATFAILTGGQRGALPRQQTLQALIGWSFDLLSEIEQTLLLRMSVFAGGCTLKAVLDVCTSNDVPASEAVRVLTLLVQKSLVISETQGDSTRYRLFESTREFSWERLSTDERVRLRNRHAHWIIELTECIAQSAEFLSRRQQFDALFQEIDNVRLALTNMFGPDGNVSIAAQIIFGAHNVWYEGSLRTEGRHWTDAALQRVDGSIDPTLVGQLWLAQAFFSSGKHVVHACERALSFFVSFASPSDLSRAYCFLGMGLWQVGRLDDALAANDKVFEHTRALGTKKTRLIAEGLDVRANILRTCGRIDDARAAYSESHELFQILSDDDGTARTIGNLAELEFMCGFTERALALLDEASPVFERLGSTSRLATARVNRAAYRLALGDIDGAQADAIQALVLAERAQDSPLVSIGLQHIATILALEGNVQRSAILMGYVDNWFEREGYQREPCEQRLYLRLRSSLISHMAETDLQRFAFLGSTLSEEKALELARRP